MRKKGLIVLLDDLLLLQTMDLRLTCLPLPIELLVVMTVILLKDYIITVTEQMLRRVFMHAPLHTTIWLLIATIVQNAAGEPMGL